MTCHPKNKIRVFASLLSLPPSFPVGGGSRRLVVRASVYSRGKEGVRPGVRFVHLPSDGSCDDAQELSEICFCQKGPEGGYFLFFFPAGV